MYLYILISCLSFHSYAKQKIIYETASIQLYNGKEIQGIAAIKHHHTEDVVLFKVDVNAQKTIQYHLSEIHHCVIGGKTYFVDYINKLGNITVFAHVLSERIIEREGYVLDKFYVYKNHHYGKNNVLTKRSVGYKITDQYHSMEFLLSNAKETLLDFFVDNKAIYQNIDSFTITSEEDIKSVL